MLENYQQKAKVNMLLGADMILRGVVIVSGTVTVCNRSS